MTALIRKALPLIIFLGVLLLSSCSPEYTRSRGDGPGADVGNRYLGPSIDMHGPVDPSFGEPRIGRAIEVESRQ